MDDAYAFTTSSSVATKIPVVSVVKEPAVWWKKRKKKAITCKQLEGLSLSSDCFDDGVIFSSSRNEMIQSSASKQIQVCCYVCEKTSLLVADATYPNTTKILKSNRRPMRTLHSYFAPKNSSSESRTTKGKSLSMSIPTDSKIMEKRNETTISDVVVAGGKDENSTMTMATTTIPSCSCTHCERNTICKNCLHECVGCSLMFCTFCCSSSSGDDTAVCFDCCSTGSDTTTQRASSYSRIAMSKNAVTSDAMDID